MPVSKPVRHHHRCESPRERACFTGSSNPRFSAAICTTRSRYCSDVHVDIAKRQRGPEPLTPLTSNRVTAPWPSGEIHRQPTKPLTRDSRSCGSYASPFAKTISILSMSPMS
jgi:hypothetical protein